MSSLAGTTEKLRSVIKIGAIIAAVFFGIYIFIMIGMFLKNIFFPSAPNAPVQAFGELPSLEFTPPTSQINYQVNTVSGELPNNFPDRMLVYKIEQPKADLLALQNARRTASIVGFSENETKISDIIYQWTNPSSNAILQYDISTHHFEIRSNYLSNQNLLTNSGFPEEERIKKDVSGFLNSLQVNLDSLEFKENSLSYLAINGTSLAPVDNIFNAKVSRINFFHKDIENDLGVFPFVYPDRNTSIVNLLVSYPSTSRMIVLEGDSYDYRILMEEYSDYPIKTPSEALEELQNGQGHLINPNNESFIEIINVYLAYYLDKDTTEYAQPVIVFEGTNATAYVPAVKYIHSEEATSE